MSEDPLKWAFWDPLLETIDPRRASRSDVALIEVIMLFPDDETGRAKAALSSFVEGIGDDAAGYSQEALVMLQRMTRTAQPISEVQEVTKERFARGIIAGTFLHKVIAANILHLPRRSMAAIADDCMSPFKRTTEEPADQRTFPTTYKISLSTWNNDIWPTFRPVAHFWAASLRRAKIDGDVAFPCKSDRFVEFLADAEFYRRQGESINPYKRGGPILRPGEAFPLPQNLKVQPSKLKFSPG
jgi:hypothetical protein